MKKSEITFSKGIDEKLFRFIVVYLCKAFLLKHNYNGSYFLIMLKFSSGKIFKSFCCKQVIKIIYNLFFLDNSIKFVILVCDFL